MPCLVKFGILLRSYVFFLLLSICIAQEDRTKFPATLIPFDIGVGEVVCAALSSNRYLITGPVCTNYSSDYNECYNGYRPGEMFIAVYDTQSTPPILLSQNISIIDRGTEWTQLISVSVEEYNNQTFVYILPTDVSDYPEVMKFVLSSDSSLVRQTANYKLVDKQTLVEIHFPLFGVLNPIKHIFYSVGRSGMYGDMLSMARLDLITEKVTSASLFVNSSSPSEYIPGIEDDLDNLVKYRLLDGVALVDPSLDRLIVCMFDIYLVDGFSFRVIQTLNFKQQFGAGVIDTSHQEAYVMSYAEGALYRLSYGLSSLTFELLRKMQPGRYVPSKTMVLDPQLRLLYVITAYATDGVDDVSVFELSHNNFSTPRLFRNRVTGNIDAAGVRYCANLVGSVVVMVQSNNLSNSELLKMDISTVCEPTNNTECVHCPPGTIFSYATRNCVPCPVGTHSPLQGMTECLACPDNGRNMLYDQQSKCNECGLNSNTTDHQTCECLPGYFPDSQNCVECAEGLIKPQLSNKSCEICQFGSSSNYARIACVCEALYYSKVDGEGVATCEPCPDEAICDGSSNIMGKPGFWRNKDTVSFMQCPFPEACTGADTCAVGYAQDSYLCGECDEGYAMSSAFRGCVPCERPNPFVWLVFCVGAILFVWRLFVIRGKTNYVIFAIMINHLQILAELEFFRRAETVEIATIFDFLSIFQFRFLSISSNVCTIPGEFLGQWVVKACITLVLLFLAVVGALVWLARGKEAILNTFVRVTVTILKFCFIANVKLVCVALICEGRDGRDMPFVNALGEPISVYPPYPALSCYEGEHAVLMGLSVLFIFLYDVSTIAIMCYLMFKNTSIDVTFLVDSYTPECRYWELVVLARRFCVAVSASIFRRLGKNWALGVIMFVSILSSNAKKPYASEQARRMDIASLHILHATFLLGVLLQSGEAHELTVLILILIVNFSFVLLCLIIVAKQIFLKAKTLRKLKQEAQGAELTPT